MERSGREGEREGEGQANNNATIYPPYQVDRDERKGAEIDYLKTNGEAWKEAGGHQDPTKNNPSQEFTHNHPSYQQLIDSMSFNSIHLLVGLGKIHFVQYWLKTFEIYSISCCCNVNLFQFHVNENWRWDDYMKKSLTK